MRSKCREREKVFDEIGCLLAPPAWKLSFAQDWGRLGFGNLIVECNTLV
jgi:hypothetical protein